MILFDITNDEEHPAYKGLSVDNLQGQYHFLCSVIKAAVAIGRPMISTTMIKALNAHAIACLHFKAGEYRPCEVTVGPYNPPAHFRVPDLMNDFINEVNYIWDKSDAVALSAYVLWKFNAIHPFVNGNGRTARALCYYIVCVKSGGLLEGNTILPELIRENREEYVRLLRHVDNNSNHPEAFKPLVEFIAELIGKQLDSALDEEPLAQEAEERPLESTPLQPTDTAGAPA